MEVLTTTDESGPEEAFERSLDGLALAITEQFGRPSVFNADRSQSISVVERYCDQPSYGFHQLRFDNQAANWGYSYASAISDIHICRTDERLLSRVIAERNDGSRLLGAASPEDLMLAADCLGSLATVLQRTSNE